MYEIRPVNNPAAEQRSVNLAALQKAGDISPAALAKYPLRSLSQSGTSLLRMMVLLALYEALPDTFRFSWRLSTYSATS